MANATHHHRGAMPSTAPEIRSVIQEKFRRFRTSGTRASGLSTEAEASLAITSGAVVAPSTLRFLLRVQRAFVVLLKIVLRFVWSLRPFMAKARHRDPIRVRHLRVRIADAREVTGPRVHIQVFEQPVIAVLPFHL